MNYREKIRKAIECPQFGKTYGEWGALNLEQRKYIKRLLDELDRADNYIESIYLENEQLKDNWKKLRKYLEKELGDRVNPNKDKWLTGVYDAYREIIDKMQELQGSDSNEKNNN